MSKFQVGEIAVIAQTAVMRAPDFARGDEVEIIEIVHEQESRIERRSFWGWLTGAPVVVHTDTYNYRIRRHNITALAGENALRKRRPPGADIVREFMRDLPRGVTV